MNHHLNIFRFFNENTEKISIENNLSRAFSICLTNNSFFLNEYIKAIISNEDYNYLFSSISEDTKCLLDIQVDISTIEKEDFSKVYAVAMTADDELDMDDFFSQQNLGEKKSVTDIFINIKDIAIIIEVKRSGENCKAQLFNQVLPFTTEECTVVPMKFSWQDTIRLMEKVKHVQQLVGQNSIFIEDFLQLGEKRFPNWFDPKPFKVIPFSSQHGNPNYIQLIKRMRQALLASNYELLDYNRLGISVPFKWASEIILSFQSDQENNNENVIFSIYPGNTKGQGYQIFNKQQDWQEKNSLNIKDIDYKLNISFNIKICHFSKYISGLTFHAEDLIEPTHTYPNFLKKSGKWKKDNWENFESFMDSHFKPEFNWRKRSNWSENFLNTDRTYFTMSLGYEIHAVVPYKSLRNIDTAEKDIATISDFINNVATSFQTLIQ